MKISRIYRSLLSTNGLFAILLLATALPFALRETARASEPDGPLKLPPLPYAYDALEPFIDAETMKIHHTKHHQAYINNANKLLADLPELAKLSPEEIILRLNEAPEAARTGLLNNVGGHINHSQFWLMMQPGGGGKPSGALAAAIDKQFGSFEEFQKQFTAAAMQRFGSGWAWLVKDGDALAILSTPNQDPPIIQGKTPLLGIDVWEHAYYLKYQNRRADYVQDWWKVVNWPYVESQFSK